MTAAGVGQLWLEAVLVTITGRLGRQDFAQWRAVETHRRAEARPRRFEERAAFTHIAHDILDIGLRNDAASAVAVENDQVEIVELDVEQLTDRKGDQRQFTDGRAILFLRRAQNREMHEID